MVSSSFTYTKSSQLEVKNIVVFIRALISGGAEKQSLFVARALQERYNVFLVVLKGDVIEPKHADYIGKEQIRIVRLRGSLVSRIFKLYDFFREQEIDIVFSFLASDNFWGAIVGKIAGVQFRVGGIRNSVIKKSKFISNKLLHFTFQNYLIFNNHSGFREFTTKKGFDASRCFVLENCFHPVKLPFKRQDRDIITLLLVARFVPQKGIECLINAVECLVNSNPNGRLNIKVKLIGYGKLESHLRELIRVKNLDQYFAMLINPMNIEKHYFDSDIYVCSSHYEGLSNTILEAMGASLPIIATNVGDNSKLVDHGKNGYLYNVGDSKTLAKHILNLVNSKEKRISFGLYSHRILTENYTFDVFQNKYFKFIDELVD